MTSSIISAGMRTPGVYLKVSLGVGGNSSASGSLRMLAVGNKLASGSALVNELQQSIGSPDDARDLFGAGSELALMCEAILDAHQAVQLDAIACSDTAGDDTATLSYSGTATEDGQLEVRMLGESVFADVTSGDTASTVASNVAAAINSKTNWPVTASATTGTVTVTAKSPRGHWYIESDGSVGGITHTKVSMTLSGGTATDDPQTALDAVAGIQYGLIVAAHEDATNLAKYKTLVNANAEPIEGRRGRFIAASRDTLANATTIATGLNAARGQLVWQENSWHAESYIAACVGAETIEAYEADRAANTDGLIIFGLLPQPKLADEPTRTEINSALNNGITPLQARAGAVELVRNTTTRSKDDASNPDFNVADVHKVVVADFIADDIESAHRSVFAGFKFDPNDTPGEVPEPLVATPAVVRDFIYSRLRFYGPGGGGPQYLVAVEELADRLVIEADATVDGRVNGFIPIDVIELFHQGAYDVRQIG